MANNPTQHQLFYAGALNEFVNDSLRDGSLSPAELLALVERHPNRYGQFRGLAESLQA
jgi:hypothetical protein